MTNTISSSCILLILHQPVFELWIVKPTINKIFLFFWITYFFFLHNHTLALKKTKRMNTELRTCRRQCFSLDFISNNAKIFWLSKFIEKKMISQLNCRTQPIKSKILFLEISLLSGQRSWIYNINKLQKGSLQNLSIIKRTK